MEEKNVNGLSFLAPPPVGADPVALWAFYNKAEKEAKEGKEKAAKEALVNVAGTENKFIKTQFGGAQLVSKSTRKAKDSLKFFLQRQNVLEACKKDEIDLKKVDEFLEAGLISEDVKEHISETKSSYLKIK